MSSIDQAFVKAFARRQTADVNQSGAPVTLPPGRPKTSRFDADSHVRIDQSIADTVAVWIDDEDAVARADRAHAHGLLKPRGKSSASPVDPSASSLVASFTTTVSTDPASIPDDLRDWFAPIDPLPLTAADAVQPAPGLGKPVVAPESRVKNHPSTPASRGPVPIGVQRLLNPVVASPAVPGDRAMDADNPATASSAGPAARRVPFAAAWEVDSFDLPGVTAELFFADARFEKIGGKLARVVHAGMQTALVTSVSPGEGRSTVAMGLAVAAAAAGIKTALVDGDRHRPTLVDDLRLDLEYGWADALRGGLSMEEVCIHAHQDQLTLVPLMPSAANLAPGGDELEELLLTLRRSFDLIVIDGGVGCDGIPQTTTAIDTALVVRDVSATDAAAVSLLAYRLMQRGIRGVGVVENFV